MVVDLEKLQKQVKILKTKEHEKSNKKLVKQLTKPITSKSVVRSSPRATVVIRQPNTPDVLSDPNRFFKSTYKNEKRNMFLS